MQKVQLESVSKRSGTKTPSKQTNAPPPPSAKTNGLTKTSDTSSTKTKAATSPEKDRAKGENSVPHKEKDKGGEKLAKGGDNTSELSKKSQEMDQDGQSP